MIDTDGKQVPRRLLLYKTPQLGHFPSDVFGSAAEDYQSDSIRALYMSIANSFRCSGKMFPVICPETNTVGTGQMMTQRGERDT